MYKQSDIVITEFIRRVKLVLDNRLKKIILFGSRARGDYRTDSDYDFLIIADKRDDNTKESVLEICVDMLNKYDTLVSFILCDENEWAHKKKFPIGLNIIKEGIEL